LNASFDYSSKKKKKKKKKARPSETQNLWQKLPLCPYMLIDHKTLDFMLENATKLPQKFKNAS